MDSEVAAIPRKDGSARSSALLIKAFTLFYEERDWKSTMHTIQQEEVWVLW